MSDNRHTREPDVWTEANDDLGFVIDVTDLPEIENVDGQASIQLKPHPSGYQITLWWREDGQRKEHDTVVPFSDRRDELRHQREQEVDA